MKKIFDLKSAIAIAKNIRKNGKKIILTGGCFDIIHIGHIKFLEAAKTLGGKLFVLLESDAKVKKLKGNKRPVFHQNDRAEALSHLKDVDAIVKLPYFSMDSEYKKLVSDLNPDIIAVTENDPNIEKKKSQADSLDAEVKVIPYVASLSSSHIAEILSHEHI